MTESTIVEQFARHRLTVDEKKLAQEQMMGSVYKVISFDDDQQTGTKYAKALVDSAAAIEYYVKLQMQLAVSLEELATLMKENAQEGTQTEGECNAAPGGES